MEDVRIEEMNNQVEVDEIGEYPVEEHEGGLGGLLTLIGAVTAIGGALFVGIKNRDKIKEARDKKRIAKLEKHGYVIFKEEELTTIEDPIEDVSEE